MLSQNDQVLDIDDPVTPRHGTDITQRIILAPMIYHDAHVGRVNNSIAIEVHNGNDWHLPYVENIILAEPVGRK